MFPAALAIAGLFARHRLRLVLALITTGQLVVSRTAHADDESGLARRRFNDESTLVVGAAIDAAPYSTFTAGQATGFADDLLDAVAAASSLTIERVPLPLHEMQPMLTSGQIDIVQLWEETPARMEVADFTVPALLLKLVVVTRRGDARISSIDDLHDKTIATGTRDSVASSFVTAHFPDARQVHTSFSAEVLRCVADGRCDAAILARLSAHWGIEAARLDTLQVIEAKIEGFDIRHGIAVRRGDTVLLGRLNEGLALVRASGEFDRIYFKWFGRYERQRFSAQEVTVFVAIALGLGMALALVAFLRQRRLTRRIATQTSELLGQRSLHAALFDNHPLSTCVLEAAPAGGPPRVLSLNRVAGRLFGIDPASATGRPIDALSLNAEIRGHLDEVIARWPGPGQAVQLENRLRDSRTVLDTTLVALTPGSNGAARLCVLSADVTRRLLADRELAQNRRLRALGELVGGIAHEFNNLLTPVLAQASMLSLERKHDAELVGELKVIEDAAKRSAALTRRLLAFGRRADDITTAVDAKAALESCVALVRPTFDRRIEWTVDLPDGLPPVACDATDLHQIAFNLIINARDTLVERLAGSDGSADWVPRLSIALCSLPSTTHLPRQPRPGATLTGWQQVTVEDNGKGIPAEHLERIYEPFFTTKEIGRGTGIGLATVWHLVNEAGSLIDVESTVGRGTRFTVSLPVWSQPEAPAPAAPHAPPPPSAPPQPRSILLVEDEGIVASAVLALLRRFGHRMHHATDGQTAWEEMQARPDDFDVLLVDINMPRMNGVDLVRHVRTTAWAGRILVMSGRVAESDMRQLERLRVDRVLIKPFTPDEIAAALGAAER